MKRLNKEYKLDVCDEISIKYGSINKDNPQVIYISGRCWISPLKKMNYKEEIGRIEKRMRKDVKECFVDDVNFKGKFILDFDINTDKMEPNNKKFFSFDFYVRQNDDNKKTLKQLKPLLATRVGIVSNGLLNSLNDACFSIHKKRT